MELKPPGNGMGKVLARLRSYLFSTGFCFKICNPLGEEHIQARLLRFEENTWPQIQRGAFCFLPEAEQRGQEPGFGAGLVPTEDQAGVRFG